MAGAELYPVQDGDTVLMYLGDGAIRSGFESRRAICGSMTKFKLSEKNEIE
ncbi:MAG: hypothetical protein Q4A75_07985 [Peptostreptococcaceae bacterium]|nr:hypothetical protein [Peptostreptococcaceae bacterium]